MAKSQASSNFATATVLQWPSTLNPLMMEAEQGPGIQQGLPQVRPAHLYCVLYHKMHKWLATHSDWSCCEFCCHGRVWSFPRVSSSGELVLHTGNAIVLHESLPIKAPTSVWCPRPSSSMYLGQHVLPSLLQTETNETFVDQNYRHNFQFILRLSTIPSEDCNR